MDGLKFSYTFLCYPVIIGYFESLKLQPSLPLTHYFARAVMVTTAADASCGNR